VRGRGRRSAASGRLCRKIIGAWWCPVEHGHPDTEGIRETLRAGAAANEDASPLAKVLADARKRLLDLIIVTPPPPPPPVPQPPVAPRTRVVRGRRDRALAELHDLIPEDATVEISYRILGDGDD
jgi:hypothetical protein